MDEITQELEQCLYQTKKTVEWLIDNSMINVFNPLKFTGYQRKVDEKHIEKIVKYINDKPFFFPTSIICATHTSYDDDCKLYIVDGQHRIEAFKKIRKQYPERYNEIAKKEIAVIIMENVKEELEIETFITINKTSKKVDTSLALILKNKNLYEKISYEDKLISRREYLAVEIAKKLNANKENPIDNNIWEDKILFEGTTKNTQQLISLLAFVKSTRSLLKFFETKKLVDLTQWSSNADINKLIGEGFDYIIDIWCAVEAKWPNLFKSTLDNRRIIQGPIGYSSINRAIMHYFDTTANVKINDIKMWIEKIDIDEIKWYPKGEYSKYSSESGYNIIVNEIIKNIQD